jgi:hypothetical protein
VGFDSGTIYVRVQHDSLLAKLCVLLCEVPIIFWGWEENVFLGCRHLYEIPDENHKNPSERPLLEFNFKLL